MAGGVLRFGDCELDFGRGELRRRGAPVEIQPTPLRVLLHLAEHRDRAVRRDELLAAIWPGVAVTSGALTTALFEARRAVGDDAASQRVIHTHKSVGYRFVAEAVEKLEPAGPSPRTPGPPVLAVLPLRGPTDDPALGSFVEKLSARVSTSVARSVSVRVLSAPTPGAAEAREAGRALGATHVLTGTVSREGDRLVISLALTSVESGRVMVSRRKDCPAGEPRAAVRAAAGLAAALASGHLPWEVADDPRRNEAIELTLQGQRQSWAGNPERGLERLGRALAIDATIPRTHLFLSYVWSNAVDLGKRGLAEALPEMDRHADAVQRLAPGSSDAHSAAITPLVYRFAWSEAERHARAALEVGRSPTHDGTNLAAIFVATGRPELALPIVRGQIELEPDEPSRASFLASALLMERRFGEAARALGRVDGDFALAPRGPLLIIARWLGDQRDQFVDDAQRAAIALGDADGAAEIARLYERKGPEAVARWIARNGGQRDPLEPPFVSAVRLAILHAIAGDAKSALDVLEALPPFWRAPEPLFWPVFDAVRETPRFLALVEKMNVSAHHERYVERARTLRG